MQLRFLIAAVRGLKPVGPELEALATLRGARVRLPSGLAAVHVARPSRSGLRQIVLQLRFLIAAVRRLTPVGPELEALATLRGAHARLLKRQEARYLMLQSTNAE